MTCCVVAHERLTEPRVTMEWLLAKPRSYSNLPAFLDLNWRWLISMTKGRPKIKAEKLRLSLMTFSELLTVNSYCKISLKTLRIINPLIKLSVNLDIYFRVQEKIFLLTTLVRTFGIESGRWSHKNGFSIARRYYDD